MRRKGGALVRNGRRANAGVLPDIGLIEIRIAGLEEFCSPRT
jgi:hypothetical protein